MSTSGGSTSLPIDCKLDIVRNGRTFCLWNASPSSRGTSDIISLCVATLIICSWHAVHPNVPKPGAGRWATRGRQMFMVVLGLFMPEILVFSALHQFFVGVNLQRNVQDDPSIIVQPPSWWKYTWLTPAIKERADIEARYVAVHRVDAVPCFVRRRSRVDIAAWTFTHSFYTVMGGFVEPVADGAEATIDPEHIIAKLIKGRQDLIPTLDDLEDRSKASAFRRVIFIWQLFSFGANCVARLAANLSLSLLEITTAAHCLCAVLAFLIWWDKPHSAEAPIVVPPKAAAAADDREHANGDARGDVRDTMSTDSDEDRGANEYAAVFAPSTNTAPAPPSPSFLERWRIAASGWIALALAGLLAPESFGLGLVPIPLIAAFYGLPHLLGLRVDFPTRAQRIEWEVATGIIVGAPVVIVIAWIPFGKNGRTSAAGESEKRGLPLIVRIIAIATIYICIPIYCCASIFIFYQSARQLSSLPDDAFVQPAFNRYLPNFS